MYKLAIAVMRLRCGLNMYPQKLYNTAIIVALYAASRVVSMNSEPVFQL